MMTNEDNLQNEEPMELVKICGPTEAEMVEEMLRNNGIEVTLQGEFSANAIPATSDLDEVRIWVRPDEAERARELVDAFFTPVGKDELQDEEQDLGVENPEEPGGFTV
jgi:hypothetical protein